MNSKESGMDYECIEFHQYQSGLEDDKLLLFAAPAREIAQWAGIPQKGWNIRMLYQRWVKPSREQAVIRFWDEASRPDRDAPRRFILGPNALTIAIFGKPAISENRIRLESADPISSGLKPIEQLSKLAEKILPRLEARLSDEQSKIAREFERNPLRAIPDIEHDYVFQTVLQLSQIKADASWFVGYNQMEGEEVNSLVDALASICRPALVVDGQHRLYGAARCASDVWLPVVAIPECSWEEQIYQFVVINEKAEKVDSSLLTDIFGSSLTRDEQTRIRRRLSRANVRVEERIAAVIAARDPESPFHNLVKINLADNPSSDIVPMLNESTIRQLIEGGRGARAWRSDDEFFTKFVKPTFNDRAQWESWTDGEWRPYWFAFWETVLEFYHHEGLRENPPTPLWGNPPTSQTNLTKAVTLRLLQTLFINKAIERVEKVYGSQEMLEEVLGEEEASQVVRRKAREMAIPSDVSEFKNSVREWFLVRGVPVRFFTKKWKSSLDDAQGQRDLKDELEKAFEYAQE